MNYFILALLLIGCGTESQPTQVADATEELRDPTPKASPTPSPTPVPVVEDIELIETPEPTPTPEPSVDPYLNWTPTPTPTPDNAYAHKLQELDEYILEKVAELNAKEIGDDILGDWMGKALLDRVWGSNTYFFGPSEDFYFTSYVTHSTQPYVSWVSIENWTRGYYDENNTRHTRYYKRARIGLKTSSNVYDYKFATLRFSYLLNEEVDGLPLLEKIRVQYQLTTDPDLEIDYRY